MYKKRQKLSPLCGLHWDARRAPGVSYALSAATLRPGLRGPRAGSDKRPHKSNCCDFGSARERSLRKLAARGSRAEQLGAQGKFVTALAGVSRGSRGGGRRGRPRRLPDQRCQARAARTAPWLGQREPPAAGAAGEGGWGAGRGWREVCTRTCCLVAQIISVFWLLRGIWPLRFAFSFIYFCLFSILFVNTNILSHPERFLPSLKIPSSSPSTACRQFPAPASPCALCCTYLALSIPSLAGSCSFSAWIPSTALKRFCTVGSWHNSCSSPELFSAVPGYFHLPAAEPCYEAVVYPILQQLFCELMP